MKTHNLIQASAEIVRVVSLKKGDVYKRLEESSYSSGDSIVYGIVLDVLYNGEAAAIQTMEFTPGYRSMETKLKVFGGDKDLKIFTATQPEVKEYLDNCVESIEQELETKHKELADTEDKLRKAKQIISGELVKTLTSPETTNKEAVALTAPKKTKSNDALNLDDIPF